MNDHPLLIEIEALSSKAAKRDEFLMETARAINHQYPQYNWVGFYFAKEGKLHIGPYVGKTTPHTVIELDKGICGAAFNRGKTIVVDDVNTDPRFLACSITTRSEIVIPIRVDGEMIGELDIDSDQKAAFGDDDRILMEKVAELVGETLSRFKF